MSMTTSFSQMSIVEEADCENFSVVNVVNDSNHEEMEAPSKLGINQEELNTVLADALDCTETRDDGGCRWNDPTKQGNLRFIHFKWGEFNIRGLTYKMDLQNYMNVVRIRLIQ